MPARIWILAALLVCLPPDSLCAQQPERWVPALWEGGPLALHLREKSGAAPAESEKAALAGWYRPETLELLEGAAINCLLMPLSAGAPPEVEKAQHKLVRDYARLARGKGQAVLGLVYPGGDPETAASAAVEAQLDGLVVVGLAPEENQFLKQLREALRRLGGKPFAVRVAPAASARLDKESPFLVVEGTAPRVVQIGDTAEATPTAGLWIDSNLWLVRSFHAMRAGRPLWVWHEPPGEDSAAYLRSVADAAAAGGRWIVSLNGSLQSGLYRKEPQASALWKQVNGFLRFFETHAAWREFSPYGNVGIVLDSAGPNVAHSEEYLNLVARRQIPYRVIERSLLNARSLEGLRAVLAFDLTPPTEAERSLLVEFARKGGLLLGGPSWGKPPASQSYQVAAAGEGEIAVYKDDAPDPQGVARDLNDLLTTPELGLSVFDAPSVLAYAAAAGAGKPVVIHLVNYASRPADKVTLWISQRFGSARLLRPEGPSLELPIKLGADRTEVVIPNLAVYGALWLE
ncbi:MAG: hypothetical protein K6T61_16855 [Bryobacteraceae bacterium]|nr:hypothetical protein [Bryobacteraceae bacterium]